MPLNPEWIGFVAATLTTVSFAPQLNKVLKEKDTKAISLGMYSVFTLGVGLWLIYGVLIGSTPIIMANIFTFIMAAAILAMKLKHG